jgi:hypothetical protein
VAYLNHQIRREELSGSNGSNPFTARKILRMLLADERPTADRHRRDEASALAILMFVNQPVRHARYEAEWRTLSFDAPGISDD